MGGPESYAATAGHLLYICSTFCGTFAVHLRSNPTVTGVKLEHQHGACFPYYTDRDHMAHLAHMAHHTHILSCTVSQISHL